MTPEPSDWQYLNAQEVHAVSDAMSDAGEYIESIGKLNFSDFTKDEFRTLCLVICNSVAKNSIPF